MLDWKFESPLTFLVTAKYLLGVKLESLKGTLHKMLCLDSRVQLGQCRRMNCTHCLYPLWSLFMSGKWCIDIPGVCWLFPQLIPFGPLATHRFSPSRILEAAYFMPVAITNNNNTTNRFCFLLIISDISNFQFSQSSKKRWFRCINTLISIWSWSNCSGFDYNEWRNFSL